MNKNELFYLTRRPRFLWKCAITVGLVIFVFGTALSLINHREPSALFRMEQLLIPDDLGFGDEGISPVVEAESVREIVQQLLDKDQRFYEKLGVLQYIARYSSVVSGSMMPDFGDVTGLSTNEYKIATFFVQACAASARADITSPTELEVIKATRELKQLADDGEQYASYAVSLLYASVDADIAEKALVKEIELYGESALREHLVDFYRTVGRYDRLDELKADPLYSEYIDSYLLQKIALARLDWPELFRTLIPAAYERVDEAMVVLSLVSGLVWAILLLRFCGTCSLQSRPVQLALPAIVLGALSAHATILFIFWQEHQLHFGMGNDIAGQLLYCLSIGFREELLKLLCFCPLIPFLWRRSDLEIMTVAGLVGLGFAIEENINYFEGSAGLSALGRFVTANFLHISLTAMGGLALVRALIHRRVEDFRIAAVTVSAIVVFHGLYDAFLIVDALTDYSWLAYATFVLLSYQYFGWLRHLRDDWRDPVSITLVFTLGVTVVTGLSYGLFAWHAGVSVALQAVAGEVISIAILLIMFYREIPETLHD